jgi:hypothetical protein
MGALVNISSGKLPHRNAGRDSLVGKVFTLKTVERRQYLPWLLFFSSIF